MICAFLRMHVDFLPVSQLRGRHPNGTTVNQLRGRQPIGLTVSQLRCRESPYGGPPDACAPSVPMASGQLRPQLVILALQLVVLLLDVLFAQFMTTCLGKCALVVLLGKCGSLCFVFKVWVVKNHYPPYLF